MIVLVEATLVSRISVQIQISVQGGILTKNQITVQSRISVQSGSFIYNNGAFIYSLRVQKAL